MAKEVVYLGSSPTDEKCAQTTDPEYSIKGYSECKSYVGQLYRVLESLGATIPDGFRLHVKSERHDFGSYYEVVASFPRDSKESWDLALKLENSLPEHWDDVAKVEQKD